MCRGILSILLQAQPLAAEEIRGAAKRNALPIVKNPCPAGGSTKRQEVKELVAALEKQYPGLKERIFGSMQRLLLTAWEPLEHRRRPYPEEGKE